MRSLFKWLWWRALVLTIVAVPLVLLALAWYCIDDAPAVAQTPQFTPAHIERAKRLLERNDPRQMRPGMLRTITLTQDDLDLALNYLVNRQLKGSTRLVLQEGVANLRASLPMPTNPFGLYLNLQLALRDTGGQPRLEGLRIGRLAVPQPLADGLLKAGLHWLQRSPEYGAAADTIRRVQVSPQMLSVVFQWNAAVADQLKAALTEPGEQERMQAYQARLVELATTATAGTTAGSTAGSSAGKAMPLSALVQPLLELAARRAGGSSASAAQLALEQRAALVVLAFYINGKGLAAIMPSAAQWPAPMPRTVTLGGRGDFAQHFSVSAALAASAGTPLSDAVGLYKEVEDSRGGSGFSFNDIAADRAGTRFGELAIGNEAAQARLRRRLATRLTDQDLLPPVKDLPEFMQEAEFKKRYGGVGSAVYKKMQADIEQRIAALPLYR